MGLATFKGGIHPYEGKELSENKPIQELLPKGDLVFPMSQHIGAPAKPLVKKGDSVLAGQKIGEAGSFPRTRFAALLKKLVSWVWEAPDSPLM